MGAYSSDFEEIYKLYPKKKGKAAGYKHFLKIKKKEPLTIPLIKKYIVQNWWDPRDNYQYVPYFSSFMCQRGWDDEIQVDPNKKQGVNYEAQKQAYIDQQKKMDQRFVVHDTPIEKLANTIKSKYDRDMNYDDLKAEIRRMKAVSLKGDHIIRLKRKTAEALIMLFSKEDYLKAWKELEVKPRTKEDELERKNILHKQAEMLKNV